MKHKFVKSKMKDVVQGEYHRKTIADLNGRLCPFCSGGKIRNGECVKCHTSVPLDVSAQKMPHARPHASSSEGAKNKRGQDSILADGSR